MADDHDNKPVLRDGAGRFQKGSRALSTGRPPLDEEVRAIFEAAAPLAAQRLVELALESEDPRVGLVACNAIIDRLYGKPAVAIDASIKASTFNEAHLQALKEIQERRQQRLLELTPKVTKN